MIDDPDIANWRVPEIRGAIGSTVTGHRSNQTPEGSFVDEGARMGEGCPTVSLLETDCRYIL